MTLTSHAEPEMAYPKISQNKSKVAISLPVFSEKYYQPAPQDAVDMKAKAGVMPGSRLLNLSFMIGGFYLFSTCIGVLILMLLGR